MEEARVSLALCLSPRSPLDLRLLHCLLFIYVSAIHFAGLPSGGPSNATLFANLHAVPYTLPPWYANSLFTPGIWQEIWRQGPLRFLLWLPFWCPRTIPTRPSMIYSVETLALWLHMIYCELIHFFILEVQIFSRVFTQSFALLHRSKRLCQLQF